MDRVLYQIHSHRFESNVVDMQIDVNGSDTKPDPFTSICISTTLDSTDPVKTRLKELVVITRDSVVPDPSGRLMLGAAVMYDYRTY
jgi:hypothetical protein